MSATLTPLPSPTPGLAARVVKSHAWSPFPAPFGGEMAPAPTATALAALPPWPGDVAVESVVYPTSWAAPLAVLPSPQGPETPGDFQFTRFTLTEETAAPGVVETPPVLKPTPAPARIPWQPKARVPVEPDFTDDDLREAFGPIVEQAVRQAVFANENGMDTYLEPMLRATIRRALAEYSPSSRPFREPGTFDRFIWHMQALFTSRTYEDILFEKTHRFQVEEVFLVDSASLALVSFASCDPARHSSAKRISSTVQRLAMQLRDDNGKIRQSFQLPDKRNAISRAGKYVTLMAVVRGTPSELVLADLEFALRRIEDRFREQFKIEGSPLLYPLQPFLEDCLLIQAPASAA